MADSTVCRCCLATDAPCRSLFNIYEWDGENEVYIDMLLESFSIRLCSSGCGNDAGICESCVVRLRDATSFKRQVLALEERFKRYIISIKEESFSKETANLFDERDHSDAEASIHWDDERVEDKGEDIEDIPRSQQTSTSGAAGVKRKAAPVRVKMTKKVRTKEPMRRSKLHEKKTITAIKIGSKVTIGFTTIKPVNPKAPAELDPEKQRDRSDNITKQFMEHLKTIPEKLKHKVNTSAIVKFSNVTPFKDKTHEGYVCFYCTNTFTDPSALREHTRLEHGKDKQNYFTKLKSQDSHVKVDITGLACCLCDQEITDLTALKAHLVAEHKKKLFTDLSDKMLPFVLKEPPLHCTICSQEFETFKMLHQHMNSHYRNFICEQCGAGFVTLKRLKFHESRHKDGEFKCSICEKTFKSSYKMTYHVKGVHLGMWQRNKCPHCPEKFTDYYKKQKHLVEVHNETKIEYRCNACNKVFSTKNRLTNHTKSFHLQEVNHQCEICSQKFYARRDLHRHMARHSDERFECKVCQKTFASKPTLREHSRGHDDDRRFACSKCSKIFKHKMTLQNHENSHHSDNFGIATLVNANM